MENADREAPPASSGLPRQLAESAVSAGEFAAHDVRPAEDTLAMLKWHLDRYDNRRISIANRASVVLSAAAILSAGSAIIISRFYGDSDHQPVWLRASVGVAALGSALLIIGTLIQASRALVTHRPSRSLFDPGGVVPLGLLFNGTDTLSALKTFPEFMRVISTQAPAEAVQAASVELWVNIKQQRIRYAQLRSSVLLLQWSAVTLALILAASVIARVLG